MVKLEIPCIASVDIERTSRGVEQRNMIVFFLAEGSGGREGAEKRAVRGFDSGR